MSPLTRTSIRIVSFILCLLPAATHADTARPVSAPGAVTTPPVIVIGFVGGFVKHDDLVHSPVQVAAHLNRNCPPDVHVEVLENARGQQALADIGRFLDTDHNGSLSAEEKRNARIILYGHSWGASQAITLARALEKEGIPVLLTVQVDSVSKPGQNDKLIPANVAEAANFYQTGGWLHGEPHIRAVDPARTHILGNFRFDYKANPIDCKQYPWYDRVFMKSHTEIECDPRVWTQVESLIRSRLPPQPRP
ncbi:MAG: hypothetical protein ACLPVW_09255 [Terriglobales bacterium]